MLPRTAHRRAWTFTALALAAVVGVAAGPRAASAEARRVAEPTRFRWVFVLHLHGAPNQSRALHDAGDHFHDTFGGRMVHLAGLLPVFSTIEGAKSEAAKAFADGSMEGLVKIAEDPAWPAYFGSPRLATAAHGAATSRVALAILDGADPRTFPRFTQASRYGIGVASALPPAPHSGPPGSER